MAIAYDSATGATGTTTSSSANLVHAANVMVIITVAYNGTTSPSGVTVGGVAATYLTDSKIANTYHAAEVWYLYRAASGTESVAVTFAGDTRHAWCAVAYTGVKSSSSFEGLATASGAAVTPTTSSVTVAAGTADRLILGCNGAGNLGTGVYYVTFAPGNGETERQEQELQGIAGQRSVGAQAEDYASSAAHDVKVNLTTTAGKTIEWFVCGVALLAESAAADTSKMLLMF